MVLGNVGSFVAFNTRGTCLCGLVVLLLGLMGCSDGATPVFSVTGRVTFEGEPVTEGVVLFVAETGFGTSAPLGPDGSFDLLSHHGAGIPTGTYQVAITPPDEDDDYDSDTPTRDYPNIPERYRDLETSELVFTVTDEQNHFEIDMQ